MVNKTSSEFGVNTTTVGLQDDPKVTALPNGNFLATWIDYTTIGSSSTLVLKAQVLGPNGNHIGDESVIANDINSGSSITTLTDGNVLATFGDSSLDSQQGGISAQLISGSTGKATGGRFSINGQNQPDAQAQPAVTALPDGAFVAAWTNGTNNRDIVARVFTPDGSGGFNGGQPIAVNTSTSGDQLLPQITSLASGGFAIAWTDNGSGANGQTSKARMQLFDSSSTKVGNEILLDSTNLSKGNSPTLAGLSNGNVVAIWGEATNNGSGPFYVVGRLYDSSGQPIQNSYFKVDAPAYDPNTSHVQSNPHVAATGDGGFLVSFEDHDDVRARLFDASGQPASDAMTVNTATDNQQDESVVAVGGTSGNPGSSALVLWDDGGNGHTGSTSDAGDIKGQAYNLVPDTTPPGLDEANANGSLVALTFTEALDAANGPDATAFSVQVGGEDDVVSAVSISGSVVSLTLETAVTAGQTVTLSYTDPSAGDDQKAIQDLAGNDAASLTGIDITNTTSGGTAGGGSAGGNGGGATPGSPPATPSPIANPPTNNSPAALPTPTIAANTTISVSNGSVVLSGQVSSGVTSVEVLDDTVDLGPATIDPSTGTWTFTVAAGLNADRGLIAVATDAQGQQAKASIPFDLATGITGEPYSIVQNSYAPGTGALAGSRFLKSNGAVYLASSIAADGAGGLTATYSEGTFFRRKPYLSFADSYDAEGNLTQHVETRRDGTHGIEIDGRGVVAHALGQDAFTDLAAKTTFVFDPGVGHELITGFKAGGRGHDSVSLPDTDASRLASILAHAHTNPMGDTTINIGHGDTITFAGVSSDTLRRHAGDFGFHG